MSEFLFLDSAVVGKFVRVDCLDLLQTLLNGRGAWTQAVEREATQHLSDADRTMLTSFLGEPISVEDPSEIVEINRMRRLVFGGEDAHPLQNLGEAETCFLLTNHAKYSGSLWISDDWDILRYAEHHNIRTLQTRALMANAVLDGAIGHADARERLHRMRTGA